MTARTQASASLRFVAALRLAAALPTWLFAVPVLSTTLLFDLLSWPWARPSPTPSPEQSRVKPNAAILILNWNGVDFLRDLLPSVRIAVERAAHLGDHVVYVIDNGSDDDSVAFVRHEHPWARVLENGENLHFIRGNNAGVQAISDDQQILVLLNNDMVVEPDFITELLTPFANPPRGGGLFATTARIEMDGPHAVETGRTRAFYKRGALRQEQLAIDDQTPSTEDALWAGGGSSAFDRRMFAELGGLDELYVPCYMEDVDLSYRAQKRGWRVQFVRAAGVHHVHRGTSDRVFGRRGVEALDRRNRELFFWRNVTDLRWLVSHALHMPWNAFKDASRSGNPVSLDIQYLALIRAIPRIPAAIAGRIRLRRDQTRRDRDLIQQSR